MLGIILIICMLFDMKARKVPNILIILGIIWELWASGLSFIPPFLTVITIGFLLFLFGMMGAGDIKLMALMAGSMGFFQGLRCIGLAWLLGAGISLFKLISSKTLIHRLSYFFVYSRQLLQTKKLTPYYEASRDGYEHTIRFTVPLTISYLLLCLYHLY